MTTMQAYALTAFEQPPGLTRVPVPEPGPHEVRVRVTASSVNPFDAAAGAGFFRRMSEYRFPAVLGRDVAGTVEAVGAEVTAWHVGDEVWGMVKRPWIGDGTFAEYVVVPDDRYLAVRPDTLPLEQAGALGLAGVTALQCLDDLGCAPGDTILINGATGGVGSFAVQLAVAAGLRVIATARPGSETDHVRGLGADGVVDWSAGDVPAAAHALAPGGVAGVVDLVSRDTTTFLALSRAAAPTGAAVTTLGAAPATPAGGPRTGNVHSDGDPVLLQRLVNSIAAGSLRIPLVDVVDFAHIDRAFDLLAAAPLGKIGLGPA